MGKIYSFFLLFLILSISLLGDPKISYAAGEDEIHYTFTGDTSVSIDWRGTSSALAYGTTTSYGKTATGVSPNILPFSSSGPFWEAKITGLTPNTLYHYSISGGTDHTFKTALSKGDQTSFTVAVIADIGPSTTYKNSGIIQGMIASMKPNFVVVPGDLSYANEPNHGGLKDADQHFNDVMAWATNGIAYMPIWGNHEWDATPPDFPDNLKNYKGRFDLPNSQTSPGSPSVSCCGEDWYWFDYGNTRFIAYPEPWSGAWADWSTKAKAIMDQAQADPGIKYIVTFGHRPAHSTGKYQPGEPALLGYIDALGSSHSKYVLNLNGHSHNYERSIPDHGVIHLTVGTGGSSLEQVGSCLYALCAQPSWSAKRFMRHGVTKLVFTPTGIQGSFICGPAGGGTNDKQCNQGDVIDSFTIGTPSSNPGPGVPSSVCLGSTAPPCNPPSTAPSVIVPSGTVPGNPNPSTAPCQTNPGPSVAPSSAPSNHGKPPSKKKIKSIKKKIGAIKKEIKKLEKYIAKHKQSKKKVGAIKKQIKKLQAEITKLLKQIGTTVSSYISSSATNPCPPKPSSGPSVSRQPSAGPVTHPSIVVPSGVPSITVSGTPVGGGTGSFIANLVTDPAAVLQQPSMGKPAYLVPYTDPIFHTKVTRIADDIGKSIRGVSGSWAAVARHHYQKDQPWSSDNSLIALQNQGGSPNNVYLDGNTYLPKMGRCSNYSVGDDRWHPSPAHPHERINVNGNVLDWFDVVQCKETKRISLPINSYYFGMGEGNPSFDGRYAVLSDKSNNMVVVDMNTSKVGPVFSATNCGLPDCLVDWVSVSPTGKFAVVSSNDRPRVYDINQNTLALSVHPEPAGSLECEKKNPAGGFIFDLGHADMTIENGDDVIIGQKRSWCSDVDGSMGEVIKVRLKDDKVTSLTKGNEAQAHHISLRSYDRPGWAYVTYYNSPGKLYSNEIIAVKIDGSGQVERFVHTHSTAAPYHNEEHGVPSRDGMRIIFASGWDLNCGSCSGSSSSNPQAYVVDARK